MPLPVSKTGQQGPASDHRPTEHQETGHTPCRLCAVTVTATTVPGRGSAPRRALYPQPGRSRSSANAKAAQAGRPAAGRCSKEPPPELITLAGRSGHLPGSTLFRERPQVPTPVTPAADAPVSREEPGRRSSRVSMQRRGAEGADRAVPAVLPPGQGCQTPTPHGQVSGPGLLPGSHARDGCCARSQAAGRLGSLYCMGSHSGPPPRVRRAAWPGLRGWHLYGTRADAVWPLLPKPRSTTAHTRSRRVRCCK